MQSDYARRQSQVPCEPVSTLNAAILRINTTVHLDTVLGEAVEGARALTGACYGVIVTVDEKGAPGPRVLGPLRGRARVPVELSRPCGRADPDAACGHGGGACACGQELRPRSPTRAANSSRSGAH